MDKTLVNRFYLGTGRCIAETNEVIQGRWRKWNNILMRREKWKNQRLQVNFI